MAESTKSSKAKQPSRGEAVRAAAAQAIHAAGGQAQLTRDRAQELADELAGIAVRVRDVLDELRPPSADDVKALRTDLAALEARVAKLEKAAPKRRATAKKSAPKGVSS
jgi:polyhydroxyalkanoate synthesis regulator phasin